MPARRCERNAVAKLHNDRHDVLQRRATRCNNACAAPPCNVELQRRAPTKLLNIGRCTLQPSSSQSACRTNIISSCNSKSPALIGLFSIGTRLLQHRATKPLRHVLFASLGNGVRPVAM